MIIEQTTIPHNYRNKYLKNSGGSFNYTSGGSTSVTVTDSNTNGGKANYAEYAGQLFTPTNIYGNVYTGMQDLIDASIRDCYISGHLDVSAPTRFTGNVTANYVYVDNLVADDASVNNAKIDEASIHNLTVTGSAHFFSLIIDEVKAAGGQLLLSAADMKVDKVGTTEDMLVPDALLSTTYPMGTYFSKTRLYQIAKDDDDKKILNKWAVGDLCYCQTFNITESGEYSALDNKYYWKLVVAVGTETLTDGKEYNYIDVASSTHSFGSQISASLGQGTFNPEVGDELALLGNIIDKERQNAIIISAFKSPDTTVKSPSIVQYKGINSFTLSGKIYNKIAANGNILRGDLYVESGDSIDTYITGKISDEVDGSFWKLIPNKSYAIVSKDDTLTFSVEYGVYKQSGDVVSLQTNSTTDDGDEIKVQYYTDASTAKHNISRTRNYYTASDTKSNYHKIATKDKPKHYYVELEIGGYVIQRDTIDVTFDAGAVLEISDSITGIVQDVSGNLAQVKITADEASSTVQDVSGNFSQLRQTVNSFTSLVEDVSGRVTAIEQTDSDLSLYVKDADLTKTGINVTAGIITLDAAKTTINGMLGLHDSDDGLVIYDSNEFPTVILDNHSDESSNLIATKLYQNSSYGPEYKASGTTASWYHNAYYKTGFTNGLMGGKNYAEGGYAFVVESGSAYAQKEDGSGQGTTSHRIYATVYVVGDTTKDVYSKTTTIPWTYNPNVGYMKVLTRNTKIPIPAYKGSDNTFTISVDIKHDWLCVAAKTRMFSQIQLSHPVKYRTHIGDDTIYALHGACDGFFTDGTKTIINGGYTSSGIMVDDSGLKRPIARYLAVDGNAYDYKMYYGTPFKRNICELAFSFGASNETVYYYKERYGSQTTLGSGKVWNWCKDENSFNFDYVILLDTDTWVDSGNKYILLPDTATSYATQGASVRKSFTTGRQIKFFVTGSNSNLRVCTYDSNFGLTRIYNSDWTTVELLQSGYVYTFTLGQYGWYVERHS